MPPKLHLHPPLVHYPIAFFALEAFLIFLWIRSREERYERFSYLVLVLAVGFMPFVMASGAFDAGFRITSLTRTHFISAVSLFLVNASRFFFRWKKGMGVWVGTSKTLYLLWLFVGLALTFSTGFFGGKIVYE